MLAGVNKFENEEYISIRLEEVEEYLKKTIREAIRNLEVNEVDLNIVYDRTLCRSHLLG